MAEDDWRWSFVRGAVIVGAAFVVITEALSLAGWFGGQALAVCWLVLSGLAAFWMWRRRRPVSMPRLARSELGALAGLVSVFVLVAVSGARSDPNNWDSLTYHLPRVAQWLQNGNVGYFATSNVRQLDQPPFSEYVIAHLVGIFGTDRIAFLVQWSALVGCCVVAARLVGQLGGDRTAQVVGALICGTAPMALLQASSTQNDVVLTFWVLVACSFALESRSAPPAAVIPWFAASCALAVLTKGTAVALLPAPALYVAWRYRDQWRSAVRPLMVGTVVALALVAPHFGRSFATFGSVVAPETAEMQRVDDPGLGSLVSNASRNAALVLATHDDETNDRLLVGPVTSLHEAMGMSVSDDRWSFLGLSFQVEDHYAHEDLAGSPIHFVLGGAAVVAALADRDLRRRAGVLIGFALAAFLLTAVTFRWQPWGARLLTPSVALLAPLVALVLAARARRLLFPVVAVLLVVALPVIAANERRPLDGASYFPGEPEMVDHYREVVRSAAESCDDVGLHLGGDTPEYPLWVFAPAGVRLRHVDTPSTTRQLELDHAPCAVIEGDLRLWVSRQVG